MKKMGLGTLIVAAVVMMAGASAAQAALIQLGNIDTNNCARAESEVRLLNARDVRVNTYCERGYFVGTNGRVYDYRLHTTVEVPQRVYVGDFVRLGSIDTNNCERARSEILLLRSRAIEVAAYCQPGYFRGTNGRVYNYRLETSMIIRDRDAILNEY